MSQESTLSRTTDFQIARPAMQQMLNLTAVREVRLTSDFVTLYFLTTDSSPNKPHDCALVIYGAATVTELPAAKYLNENANGSEAIFGLLLNHWVESAEVETDGTLTIQFDSLAKLTVDGLQTTNIEESWCLHASPNIYGADLYSCTVPNGNLICADSRSGLFAYLSPSFTG